MDAKKFFYDVLIDQVFSKEVAMGIDMVITAGDRHQSPYFPMRPEEKPSTQGATTGSFEDALRLALARAS